MKKNNKAFYLVGIVVVVLSIFAAVYVSDQIDNNVQEVPQDNGLRLN